jgi:MinD-like ATPase involved in chromosome partitioning or flagellar assembly
VTVPVLTAVPGTTWEADLIASLEQGPRPLTVVRRCVDLPDLLAAAAAGTARAVLLGAQLRRLDRDALDRLALAGVAVVGLVTPGDREAAHRLRQLGVLHVLPADAGVEALAAAVAAAVAGQPPDPRPDVFGLVEDAGEGVDDETGAARSRTDPGLDPSVDPLAEAVERALDGVLPLSGPGASAWADPARPLREVDLTLDRAAAEGGEDLPVGRGRLVAVWGPTGAPGRTTVATTLASEAARLGVPALLADADVYGGVVAQVLGLLDEAPGLAAAARLATTGSLDLPALARLAPVVPPGLRVLTGIARADRWPELRPGALEAVWALARSLATLTVVDCGFCLEQDEELSFDTVAPRRNGATLTTLEAADVVVAVGAADPVGLQRLVRGVSELREALPGVAPVVVLNRVRGGPVGRDHERQLVEALERYAGLHDPVLVPDDRNALDLALRRGEPLAEVAPGSPARKALAALAARLAGVEASAPRRGARRRARR